MHYRIMMVLLHRKRLALPYLHSYCLSELELSSSEDRSISSKDYYFEKIQTTSVLALQCSHTSSFFLAAKVVTLLHVLVRFLSLVADCAMLCHEFFLIFLIQFP